MRRLVAAALVATVGGCSMLVMDQVPDDWRPSQQPRCTSSRVPPAVDVVLMALDATGAGVAFGRGDAEQGTASLLFSVLWLSSAVMGFGWAGDCRKAQRAYDGYDGESTAEGIGAARRELRSLEPDAGTVDAGAPDAAE